MSRFAPVSASGTAKAYLSGLFADQAHKPIDLSKDSLVLTYYGIRRTVDLTSLQSLGDWVLWTSTVFPEGVAEIAESLGRLCYYRCYRLVPAWVVYEELADNMPTLVSQLRQAMIEDDSL